MKLSDFDFDLPEDLIATRPARPRTAARLLVAERDRIADRHVRDLCAVLRPGDRLVLNDTRVIPARLFGTRDRAGATANIEVTLLEPRADGTWSALVKPLRKLRDGEVVVFSTALSATVEGRDAGQAHLRFNLAGEDFDAALEAAGQMPLPPYIAARRPPTPPTGPTTRPSGHAKTALWPRPRPRCISRTGCWTTWRPWVWSSPT